MTQEVIFVGLPGPYHNYGGLSVDNVASSSNRHSVSNPQEAVLQALELVAILRGYGVTVGVLPPQLRPHVPSLASYTGTTTKERIATLARENPALLETLYSSSAMWTANAATVAPATDTQDKILHLTTANLNTKPHRRVEAEDTHRILRSIFGSSELAAVHPALDASLGLRDEGAANHTRLAASHQSLGLHLFVYGADGSADDPEWARQTLSASKQVAAQHRIPSEQALFIRQNPNVINQGVFHNDVIAVGHLNVLLYHEEAFSGSEETIHKIEQAFNKINTNQTLCKICIKNNDLSVTDAIKTYIFNSQIISKPDGGMVVIAPKDVEEHAGAHAMLQAIKNDPANPISEIRYVDLRQSMRNGGGPACLRLRVVMEEACLTQIQRTSRVIVDDALLEELSQWATRYYPKQFSADDLRNPEQFDITVKALEQLTAILKIPVLPSL